MEVIYDIEEKSLSVESIGAIGRFEMVMIAWIDGLGQVEIQEVDFTVIVVET